MEVASERIEGVSANYGERRGLLAVTGSSGYLEVALSDGSAAQYLRADIGVPVAVYPGGR